jgi:hypothetical protein
MNGPQVSIVCVVVDYFSMNKCVWLCDEVSTLLCDVVLHEFVM